MELEHGTISGKKSIYVDGQLHEQCQDVVDYGSEHRLQIDGHEAVVVIKQKGLSWRYDLVIDDVSQETSKRGPEKVTIAEDPTGLRLTYRWYEGAYVWVVVFGLFWLGILATMTFAIQDIGPPLFLYLILFGFLVVGVGLPYWAVAKLVNRTIIYVTDKEVSIEHRPLRWPGPQRIPANDVRQLYCEPYTTRDRPFDPVTIYRLCVVLKDNRKVVLKSGIEDDRSAEFIKSEMGKRLGIPDQKAG